MPILFLGLNSKTTLHRSALLANVPKKSFQSKMVSCVKSKALICCTTIIILWNHSSVGVGGGGGQSKIGSCMKSKALSAALL